MISTTVHIPPSNLAAIKCVHCAKVKEVSLARFKNVKHEITIKCSCGKKFIVKLNFRKYYRRPVNLFGQYTNPNAEIVTWAPVKILDLSMGGFKMKLEFLTEVLIGSILRVRFKLDGKKVVVIDKQVKVIFANENILGCEFLDLALEEKELGFYLLNL
ncbi:PilZ domain-containing protein [Desulfopila aestuarii]|uniref:PilZ domain-containing protein n=1 Tax=Desulfopila aestuarii DSM 18488 TaxID=1121416 RepID=A0A1M7Y0Z6_9BACT|nr:PilZ domain-containing protein [Desulfopila aestuarii]SHO45322.1 PilZ domain-containing protein [Desulfopila aestuarii DSM 18488]